MGCALFGAWTADQQHGAPDFGRPGNFLADFGQLHCLRLDPVINALQPALHRGLDLPVSLACQNHARHRAFGVKIQGIAPGQVPENRFRLGVGLFLPANRQEVGILLIARRVMRLAVDLCKKRRDVLDLVVNRPFQRGGIAAERDRGQINHQIAVDDSSGDLTVVVVGVADAGVANPAEKIPGAVADFLVAQRQVVDFPALGGQLLHQRGFDSPAGNIVYV